MEAAAAMEIVETERRGAIPRASGSSSPSSG